MIQIENISDSQEFTLDECDQLTHMSEDFVERLMRAIQTLSVNEVLMSELKKYIEVARKLSVTPFLLQTTREAQNRIYHKLLTVQSDLLKVTQAKT